MGRIRVFLLSMLCLALPCGFQPEMNPVDATALEQTATAPLIPGWPTFSLDRLVDGGRAPAAFCFAPGTDPEVMREINELMHNGPDGTRYYLAGRWSGTQGSPRALTWSFVPDGLWCDGETSELFSRMDALFGDRATWVAKFQECFDRWEELTGLSYTRITYGGNDWDDGGSWGWSGGSNRGDIRIGMIPMDGSSGVLAYNYYPSNGDMLLDRDEGWENSWNNYRFLRNIVMHEHGHGIGLQHVCSDNSSQLLEPYLSTSFDGPQDDDVRAGQRHYGDNSESDDSSGAATDIGTVEEWSPIHLGEIPSPSVAYASLLSIDANSESDYFRFTITGARAVSVTLTPIGRVYDSSPQTCGPYGDECCSGNDINSKTMANLNMQIRDTDGSTVLATADSQPAGTAEEVVDLYIMDPGNYYIRVYEGDSPSESQCYKLDISVEEADCNENGILDPCDVDCGPGGGSCDVPGCGQSEDCNDNDTPDECELATFDCNNNGTPDDCDITGATSVDCQPNGTPDECELAGNDCNGNLVPDDCDVNGSTSVDCQPNGTPDECELTGNDCQPNGTPDDCEEDCNENGVPDDCDTAVGTSLDCNANSIPDECEYDCNTNGFPDECDVISGTSNDCNANGVPDECDAASCSNIWEGFQADPPFVPYGGVHGIDFVAGDGSVWDNPSGSATVRSPGCETGESDDYMIRVTSPLSDPEAAYVTSEYFRTVAGELPQESGASSLAFYARIEVSISTEYDWEFSVYDAASQQVVVQIQFASQIGAVARPGYVAGRILVNTGGRYAPEYTDTGVSIALDTCYDIEVVLDNMKDAAEAVEVYVDGELKVTTKRLQADARRIDYFEVMPVDNSASGDTLTRFILDGFDLCATGILQPPSVYDCNGNGQLDECDIASVRSHDCDANGVPDDCEDFLGMGDFDGNEIINLLDYDEFQACLTAPDVPFGAGCDEGDFDCDGDIDLRDFSDFQEVFDGA